MIPDVHLLIEPFRVDRFIQVEKLESDEVKMGHDAVLNLLLLVDLASVSKGWKASEA